MQTLSPLRARLASFEHAYVIAARLRRQTGCDQFIVRTLNPLQPVRVTTVPPDDRDYLIAWLL
jgi:hypothetical protein